MKAKKSTFLLILLVVLLVFVGIAIFTTSRTKIYNTPSWKDITPGKSTKIEVDNTLGPADKTEERGGFQIYIYKDRQDLGWKWVEVWIEPQSSKVLGILLTITKDINSSTNMQLINLAKEYRKPNFVSWTTLGNERFFAWTNRGIAIEANISSISQTASPDYSKINTTNTFLFEPQSEFSFTRFKWPWPAWAGWNSENMYKSGTTDAPDLYPKDPIDWPALFQSLDKNETPN